MGMPSETFEFAAELWEPPSGKWVFLSLPEDVSEEIREMPRIPRGFGSVRVEVRLGGSSWGTSVFPDSRRGRYILPVKKAVRVAEKIDVGDTAQIVLTTLE